MNTINGIYEYRKQLKNHINLIIYGIKIKEAEACQYSKIHTFAQYIKNDAKAVEQACLTNFSNALLEGNVNRAKAVKRSMYNRASIASLRVKMIYQGRTQALKSCT